MTSDHHASPSPEGGDGAQGPSYEVGYGKPPAHSRFRKGVSGNPRGRKSGSRNVASLLTEALDARVDVTEKGKRKKKTMLGVIITQLVRKSANADLKATDMVLALEEKHESRAERGRANTSNIYEVNEDDVAVFEAFKTRLSNNGSDQ